MSLYWPITWGMLTREETFTINTPYNTTEKPIQRPTAGGRADRQTDGQTDHVFGQIVQVLLVIKREKTRVQ